MNEQQINQKIENALAAIEDEHDVTILHAAESGSRAWGFASPDSDYDVRFIFVRPLAYYLSVAPRSSSNRGTIILPIDDELDLHGWDLRKALGLIDRGNAAAIEWLYSPIIYRQEFQFLSEARHLIENHCPTARLYNHYSSLAVNSYKRHLDGQEHVRLKKYFYALRALFAAQWVKAGRGRPPVPFYQLLEFARDSIPTQAYDDILQALRDKGKTNETDKSAPLPALSAYIADALRELPLMEADEVSFDVPTAFDPLMLATVLAHDHK